MRIVPNGAGGWFCSNKCAGCSEDDDNDTHLGYLDLEKEFTLLKTHTKKLESEVQELKTHNKKLTASQSYQKKKVKTLEVEAGDLRSKQKLYSTLLEEAASYNGEIQQDCIRLQLRYEALIDKLKK